MIVAIIIITSAFVWLGYESDWMRVRLLVGAELPKPIKQRRRVKALSYSTPWTRNFGFSPGIKLGKEQQKWIDWAGNHKDLINQPCRLELRVNGNKYNMTVKNDSKILAEVIKVNTQRHKVIDGARLYKG